MPETNYQFKSEIDGIKVSHKISLLALKFGFPEIKCQEIKLAVLEIAGNAVKFSGKGTATVLFDKKTGRFTIIIQDQGPGIKDIDKAMSEKFSTVKNSLGLGLNVAQRMMDEFKIISEPEKGTKITMTKNL